MSKSSSAAPPPSAKPSWVLPYRTQPLTDFYTLGKKLGQGQFGTTFLCTDKQTGFNYACKTIPKRKLLCKEDYEDVWREIQIMHHLSEHPNIVRIKGTYEDPVSVHLVMELCEGGELFDRIVQKGQYSEREAAKLIGVIVSVLESCHSLGVMHRDLKPENFLFQSVDEDAALKATDFGLSVFYKPGETFSDVVGSPYYVAPDVLRKHYGPESDVWSAGVILYILLSGVPPFWAETEIGIFRQILQGRLDFESEPWPGISASAKDLIRKMLDRNPKRRLTAHEVLCHPWIVDDKVAPDKPLDSAVLSRLKQFSAMNKLKKMALRVIAERLSEEEIGGLKELFKMIDTDNSGTITFDELKEGLKRVGSELMESEIKDLMDAADIDNSGTIDYGEFLAATIHLNKLEREENLLSAFSYFDKDGSGFITIDELQLACKEFGLSELHLDDMISEIDEDNDGRIDYGEFAAMMRKGNGGVGRGTVSISFFPSTPYEWEMRSVSSPSSPTPQNQNPEKLKQQSPLPCEWDFTLASVVSSPTNCAASDTLGVLEFDPSDSLIATAGIARKIRGYRLHNLLPQDIHHNATTITQLDHSRASDFCICTPAKLSSLRWKPNANARILGSGDYDGVVTEYDLEMKVPIFERDEHGGRRVWSVDYSTVEPVVGASGSDDGTVQVWDTRCESGECVAVVQPSVVRSPVCCVEFNPYGGGLVAVGCADRKAYGYDRRKMREPVVVFEGHGKTVTYVKFVDGGTVVSASTDGSLKMWKTEEGGGARVVRTYEGHVNGRSFVGLSVWRKGGLIGCGSEDKRVFVYDKRWGEPIWVKEFDGGMGSGYGLVSSVCWRQVGEQECTLVAGGSDGVLQVFVGHKKRSF